MWLELQKYILQKCWVSSDNQFYNLLHTFYLAHTLILLSLSQEIFLLSLWIWSLACPMGKWQPWSQGYERPWERGWANDSFCKTFFNKIQIWEVLHRENNHINLMLNGLPRLVGLGLMKVSKVFGGVHHIPVITGIYYLQWCIHDG